MIIKNLLHSYESYTHKNWVYRGVNVDFSRLYYIIDGEAYYEEGGKRRLFKKGHLYLTPIKKNFDLYENPDDKLLHTYSHIITSPPVTEFTEIEVTPGTPLDDAVQLWRKHIRSGDSELLSVIISMVLLCVDRQNSSKDVCLKIKKHLDSLDRYSLDMSEVSRELGYSREHITRIFSAAYHVTPAQYFAARKMSIALSHLLSGKQVTEVAEMMGYSSPYAFSKAFKKHFGLSPQKYLPTLEEWNEAKKVDVKDYEYKKSRNIR